MIGEVWWKELSRIDRAEATFDQALEIEPDSREAVSALAKLYERSGNWNLALEMLKREHPLDKLQPVITAEQLVACQRAVRTVRVDAKIRRYITEIETPGALIR